MNKDVLGLVNVKTPSFSNGRYPMPVVQGKEVEHLIVKRSECPVDVEQYIQDTFKTLFMKHHELNMMCWEENGRLHFAVVKYTLRKIIFQHYFELIGRHLEQLWAALVCKIYSCVFSIFIRNRVVRP